MVVQIGDLLRRFTTTAIVSAMSPSPSAPVFTPQLSAVSPSPG